MRSSRLAAGALAAAWASAAHGQAVPGSPTGLLIDQGRMAAARQAPSSAPIALPATPDHVTSVAKGASNAGPIKGVRFDGVEAPARVAEAARPFLGRPASAETLQALANALSDAYGHSAIALYTIAIPAQSFDGGILHVQIAEGFIEQAIVTGDIAKSSVKLVKQYAKVMAIERPLRKSSLQRYLSLIRDIPGITVDAKLLGGDRPGGVKLVLILKQRSHDFALSFDNQTQQQLSNGEFQAQGKLYGALRPGDETDLTVATSTNFKAFQYGNLTHSTPIGADGTRATVSIGHLATRTRHSHIKGNADIASFGISHPLIRSYQRNLTLNASVDTVNSDNAVLGSLLARERTRAARAAAVFSHTGTKHVLSASLIVSRGLDVLGADTATTLADPRFTKVNGTLSLSRSLGKHFVARLNGTGQWSDDALPAVERFLVGGTDYGRAFPVATLAADRGAAGSAEIAWRPSISKAFANSEIYLFGDEAGVRYVARGPIPAASYDLASAGGGVRLAFRDKGELDLEAARRIDRPFPGFDKDWQLNVAWRLSLGR
jgi:hemolysin activation/secretion protein